MAEIFDDMLGGSLIFLATIIEGLSDFFSEDETQVSAV